MNKLFFLLFLLSALFIFFTSCTKKKHGTINPSTRALEQRYPQWTNLTWVATDKDSNAFPRLEISIRENVVIIRQDTSAKGFISGKFTDVAILGNLVTFLGDGPGHRLTAYFKQTDSTVILRTQGLPENGRYNVHTYLLRKRK